MKTAGKSGCPNGCPDKQTLLSFVQGKFVPPKMSQWEAHISACETCNETLRGLDANDTLSQYVAQVMEEPESVEEPSETHVIDGLMQRLLRPEIGSRTAKPKAADAEILADKAAEVLRCIEPPQAADDDSLGYLGNYRLLRLIGAGGTGVVFQARDQSLDRVVALKVLRPSLGAMARDRFMAEARLAASIEHENVVTIYQVGQQDRLAFIAMQWLPGETLEAQMMRDAGTLDEATVRAYVTQIAAGLAAAHQRQLIHRDIKPANVWICEETQRIKILDFGLARVTDEDVSFTQTGMLAGTPNFMSPEQTRGMELDTRSDLFSLGCVMYQMLTGKLPFSAPTILATLQTIQTQAPRPPIAIVPECSQDLSDLTMSLLEKLPGNRVTSCGNLIQCLANERSQWPEPVAVVGGKALAAGPSALKKLPEESPVRKRGGRWFIAVSLLALLGCAGWFAAPQIIRIVTDQGELVIETDDPNVKIEILKNGTAVQTVDPSTGESLKFDIASGEYTFKAAKDGSESKFEVTPNQITMTRGGRKEIAVKIIRDSAEVAEKKPATSTQLDPSPKSSTNPLREAWASMSLERKIREEIESEQVYLELWDSLGSGHPKNARS